jgi:hypothetical protein
MAGVSLPEPFQRLAPFSAWALPTERERRAKRLSSSMEEIQAFYDALFPQLEAVVAYLDQFPLDQLPEEAQSLYHLMLSLVEVTSAVELYHHPQIFEAIEPTRFRRVE